MNQLPGFDLPHFNLGRDPGDSGQWIGRHIPDGEYPLLERMGLFPDHWPNRKFDPLKSFDDKTEQPYENKSESAAGKVLCGEGHGYKVSVTGFATQQLASR